MAVLVLAAAAGSARADAVDDFLKAEMSKRHIPGLSVVVVRDGKAIKTKGYGLANVETGTRATPDTVYELASVTKPFTAVAVMMLVEEGKVGLEESVLTYLPDLPEAWKPVTVRHLLNHTSGIRSYTSMPAFLANLRKDYTQAELIRLVGEFPLGFQPGERFVYNNTGYFLLGMLIEKVSGKSYEGFLKERIFQPLGMNATRLNSRRDVIPNRAAGYDWSQSRLRNAEYVSPTQPFAAGALVSSVRDMAKWDAALNGEKLLKRSTLEQMWQPTLLANGKTHNYGLGWAVYDYQGQRVIGHGGGIPGFSTYVARFPQHKLTVTLLSNLSGVDSAYLAHGVAARYIPALAEAEKRAQRARAEEAKRPAPKEDPKITERLRTLLQATIDGTLDPDQFTPAMRAEIFPDRVEEARTALRSLGALKTLTLLSQSSADGVTTYRYPRGLRGDEADLRDGNRSRG
jgi:D-alanyl-D-alanine carboxypeptidase